MPGAVATENARKGSGRAEDKTKALKWIDDTREKLSYDPRKCRVINETYVPVSSGVVSVPVAFARCPERSTSRQECLCQPSICQCSVKQQAAFHC